MAGYAVMHNHYRIIVKLCPEQVEQLADDEVLERWTSLFKEPPMIQCQQNGESLDGTGLAVEKGCIDNYRHRLS